MIRVTENLQRVRETLRNEACLANRDPDSVRLLAVSKRQPLDAILAAHEAGQRDFGENFVDEGVQKIRALTNVDICWHFIGAIQSNKTRAIASHFDWVHTVDRLKIAKRLSDQRGAAARPLQVCIQVNIDDEPQKAGVSADQISSLAAAIAELPHLQLRGLMCIPRSRRTRRDQRAPFAALHAAFTTLKTAHPELDTLSMGMSADLGAAIAEGASIVRIGTAIFGART
ncbi:MAG: YggS family pyridoxal phosphate-dependent enzyme [Pseudomonadota bacterium]